MATSNGGFSSDCVIDDCLGAVVAKSLCNKHYLRLTRCRACHVSYDRARV